MELRELSLAELHFPKEEWQWLRPSAPSPGPLPAQLIETPDAFLWTAKVGDSLWAWHPRGGALDSADQTARVRALTLETDGSELEAYSLYLKTTFTAIAAQDVEWVVALQLLESRFKHDPAQQGLPKYWGAALEACGLSPHLGALAQRGRFKFLTREERQLIFEKRWDLSALELAETLPQTVRGDFVAAARKWNLTAGHAKECLNFVMMLFKKMGEKTVRTVLASPSANAEEFRTTLMRTAQPELSTLSQKRIEMLRALRVPARTAVYGDPSFESDLLKITHTPRKLADFELFKAWVNDKETMDGVRELLEIYQ